MEGPSEYCQLIQAFVVIAIGVMAIIVMFDSKTRRDKENRLGLILGHRGCPQVFDPAYLKDNARSFASDSRQAYSKAKKLAKKEGLTDVYGLKGGVSLVPGETPVHTGTGEVYEGIGVVDDTACAGKAPGTRILCNLESGNNHNYYEGLAFDSIDTDAENFRRS